MRYLYVLAIDEPGRYQRMTALSMLSARSWDRAAHVTLLTDARTRAVLDGAGTEIPADETVVIDTPEAEARLRSRFLKTSMRAAVAGDFLFLDADTVVCGDLSPLTEATADLSAVADQHRAAPILPDVEAQVFAACNWSPPTRINLNSGVLYWRDTAKAHDVSRLWQAKWKECHAATGRHNDQQALNSAVEDARPEIAELPAAYNAQVDLRPEKAFSARVWHLFSSNRGRIPTMQTVFEPHWSGEEALDRAALDRLFRRSHPFAVDGLVGAFAISLLARNSGGNLPFGDWRRLWLAGERPTALKALARSALSARMRTHTM